MLKWKLTPEFAQLLVIRPFWSTRKVRRRRKIVVGRIVRGISLGELLLGNGWNWDGVWVSWLRSWWCQMLKGMELYRKCLTPMETSGTFFMWLVCLEIYVS